MDKFCLYSDSYVEAPCISLRMKKYSYIKDFINNNPQPNEKKDSIPIKIKCIDQNRNINKPICISCMFCVFGCVGNKILLSKELRPEKMCVDISNEQIQELKESLFPRVFKGYFLRLPQVPLSHLSLCKYPSFCDFTSVEETKNIAPWGANALKFLSTSLEPRVSLEVWVNIKARDRGGRLDITLMNLNEKYLFVAETKVSFEKMMNEDRYESQMLAYETVLSKECDPEIKRCKFLLIGGKESDLLPEKHNDCSSSPEKSNKFYNTIREANLFFISANALLALGLMKLYVSQKKYNLENLYTYITDNRFIGLLSSGLITRDGEIVPF